jgi:phosphatidylserine decarboxylase
MITIIIILAILILILLAVYIYLRKVWFYRDPNRKPNYTGKEIISPADGQVMYIEKIKEGVVKSNKKGETIDITEISKMQLEKKEGWLIGIYMSPLDVHFNYAPLDSTVADMAYTPSKLNLPMVDLWEYIKMAYLRRVVNLISKKYRLVNERNTVMFNGKIQVVIVEIADKFVSKITPLVKKGEKVKAGQKIGFIDRGSQVDIIIFDTSAEITVKTGQQVYGAKTVVATINR